MFAKQVGVLQPQYRSIRFDWRGQGRSEVTCDEYDIESLYLETATPQLRAHAAFLLLRFPCVQFHTNVGSIDAGTVRRCRTSGTRLYVQAGQDRSDTMNRRGES
jgi:hypothetical protein